ncbi:porin [Aporhodopirellula aestuarii]|uniref:Porin n=1 Tax=Aporhodopirellula aestuarii TaxID=2950107 RepID=A0ABT0U811_9BACT|nr:porin [Aporhodopirellula aestuarii]MCM2373070.1 porin [Aporhodopirellula aestuarii]
MKSKRSKLLLAICGIAAATWGSVGPTATMATAQDTFVSDAIYQQTSQNAGQIQQVGFCGGGSECDASPVYESDCGCESPCDCDMGGYCTDESCGCDEAGGFLLNGCQCDLGEPFSLFGEAHGITVGGWTQFGYHTKAVPLFNNRPDEYQLHQAWLYAEKAIDTSSGFDFGGRIDYVYGTDAQDTQAFGINNDHWDNDWDHGSTDNGYGHALPQVYGEIGYGDLSVKFGHFFTLIGYEVVAAPDNFFYSHAYTMYNSEPFTHTGALFTYEACDDITAYGGYTLGWDSGFEDNGDSFLGGATVSLTDNYTVTYATTAGRFSKAFPDGGQSERGYMHSIVSDVTVTDKIQYIGQSDYLRTKNAAGNVLRDTIGMNNYLIYTVSDCLALGSRFEWYQASGVFDNEVDIYACTLGANFKPHANVLVRPEVRWDWVDGVATGILENDDDQQTTFGIDTIFLF